MAALSRGSRQASRDPVAECDSLCEDSEAGFGGDCDLDRNGGAGGRLSGKGSEGSEAEPSRVEKPLRAKDFYQGCDTQEGSQRQGHFGPFAGIAADGQDCQPDECGCGGGEDGQKEAFEAAAKAQPCSQHGHQLGVAQADAFAAADEPVGEPDEEDQAGGGEDGERGVPGGVRKVDGLIEKPAGPGFQEREEEARADAG